MILSTIFFKMTLTNKINGIKCFQLFQFIFSKYVFCLFLVIFLLRLNSLALKSVFVTKFACDRLALKASAAKVLNSAVVIYLS